ncbi:MAG: hypothetical protein AAF488_04475, partial [Planctomycetota bacterium]
MTLPSHAAPRCRHCDAPLSGRLALTGRRWCDAPQCAQKGAAQEATESRARLVEEAKQLHPSATTVGVVPAEPGDLSPVTEERRRNLAEHLRSVIERDPSRESLVPALRDPNLTASGGLEPLEAPSSLIAAACGTCRGRCCNQGEDHGFINAETIVDYRE